MGNEKLINDWKTFQAHSKELLKTLSGPDADIAVPMDEPIDELIERTIAALQQPSAPANWDEWIRENSTVLNKERKAAVPVKALRARLQGQQGEAEPEAEYDHLREALKAGKVIQEARGHTSNGETIWRDGFTVGGFGFRLPSHHYRVKPETESTPAPTIPDRDAIGQAVSDFFAPLDNGDGTLAFDHCDSDDIDRLVGVMLYVLDAGTTIPEGAALTRDAFERYIQFLGYPTNRVHRFGDPAEYENEFVHFAWTGWREAAKRANFKGQLPLTAAPDSGGDK